MSGAAAQVPPWRMTRRNTTSTVALNLDILRHILNFIDNHEDLIAAMSTSHALYNAGIQPLVRLPITISEHELRSFHDFMLAHSPSSFLAFQKFCFYANTGVSDISLVLDLLYRGTDLKQLQLPCEIFYQSNAVVEAVVTLTKLEKLTLHLETPEVVDSVLTRLQSPLTKIDISFGVIRKDPVASLANFQDTLEQAKLSSVTWLSMDVCYPKLVKLELQMCSRPPLSVLTTAFPNLKTLTIYTSEYAHNEVEHMDQLEDLRNRNLAFQEGRICWASLSSVTADLVSLYAMGLKTPLQSLTIQPVFGKLNRSRLSYLRIILSTMITKSLSFTLPDTVDLSSEVFSGNPGNSLVSLSLDFKLYKRVDHEKSLSCLLHAFASVNTTIFHLKLEYIDVGALFADEDEQVEPHPGRAYLNDLDQKTFVERIGASMHNVACICLDIKGRGVSYWMKLDLETDEWTQAKLPHGDAARAGLSSLFSRAFSILSSRGDNVR